jgi:hypothetical protein
LLLTTSFTAALGPGIGSGTRPLMTTFFWSIFFVSSPFFYW